MAIIRIWRSLYGTKMHLRRKPAFYRRPGSPIPAKTFLPVHLNRHPDCDYEPIGHHGTAWTGKHRRSRQLVVVKEVTHARLADFSHFAGVAHVNVARQLGIYHVRSQAYLAYEYVDLDVLEALPLSQEEISAVVSQVSARPIPSASGEEMMAAIDYLRKRLFTFRIDAVRVTTGGVVKIVPDWSFEPTADPGIREANDAYLAADLETFMTTMEPNERRWTRHALGFLGELGSGRLPLTHPYLNRASSQSRLREAARFSVQRRLAGDCGTKS
ncbi:hypothetical protein B0T10DRAFT_596135 [Thelonectria olida]|uniref:Uncharacterized protein n=1 Tax=Thelonectria olida TaxID=1576542 RepID=A0A9P8VN68_9HYPO|nr:hypothetical protein B0T10DRAFT_596135 [Thelonectria olida]